MNRDASFRPGNHQILDPDIGKGATRHHLIVTAPASITVKVKRLDASFNQVPTSGRVLFDRSRGRDVVGCYRVAENSQGPGIDQVADATYLHREVFEERRLVDVITFLVPFVHIPAG